jgi:hypothetical protein
MLEKINLMKMKCNMLIRGSYLDISPKKMTIDGLPRLRKKQKWQELSKESQKKRS